MQRKQLTAIQTYLVFEQEKKFSMFFARQWQPNFAYVWKIRHVFFKSDLCALMSTLQILHLALLASLVTSWSQLEKTGSLSHARLNVLLYLPHLPMTDVCHTENNTHINRAQNILTSLSFYV